MKRALVATALCSAVLFATPSVAQQTVKLTIVSGNAPAFTPIGAAIETYIPAVDKALAASGTKINWVQGWGGQIVKPREELQGVQTGLGDIGVVPGAFYGDKLTLIQIGYNTPFTSSDVDVTTAAMNQLTAKFPELGKQAERFNQVYLALSGVADDYSLVVQEGDQALRGSEGHEDRRGRRQPALGFLRRRVARDGGARDVVQRAADRRVRGHRAVAAGHGRLQVLRAGALPARHAFRRGVQRGADHEQGVLEQAAGGGAGGAEIRAPAPGRPTTTSASRRGPSRARSCARRPTSRRPPRCRRRR